MRLAVISTVSLLLLLAAILGIRQCADWLVSYENVIAVTRNLALLVVALVGLPILVWRSLVAERQADAAQRQSKTAQRVLLNNRYQTGAEMLGNTKLTARLGGIYILRDLAAEESSEYHLKVMRLFCAFVRDQHDIDVPEEYDRESETHLRTDIQAVMDAISARTTNQVSLEELGGYRVDLRWADLRRLNLESANLANTRLSWAKLQQASLRQANLADAVLNQADLTGARLEGTVLTNARLQGATLTSAVFWTSRPPGRLRFISYEEALAEGDVVSANLSSAELIQADLTNASLQGVDLSDSLLHGSNLTNADLHRANLSGARFSNGGRVPAIGLTQYQLDSAVAAPNNPPFVHGVTDHTTGRPLRWRSASGN